MVVGILAHVDAGKTTLSEALLYHTGNIRKLGRVDHQDAFLDTDTQERERGITIFSKQARLSFGDLQITLLDTPGHVDFSAEMERTLSCLDYAILVISGSEGVQGHTRTLWRLLKHYQVPTFLFINKMDLPGADQEQIDSELKAELSEGCIDFGPAAEVLETLADPTQAAITNLAEADGLEEFLENIAVLDEAMLDEYMETMTLSSESIRKVIRERKLFPCFYGSALKLEGVHALINGLASLMEEPSYPSEFAARVYKVGRDPRGVRLTHMKIIGGELKVREKLEYRGLAGANDVSAEAEEAEGGAEAKNEGGSWLIEKVDQIRKYSGEKFETCDIARAGEIVAVTGLSSTFPGQGIGAVEDEVTAVLEPVLNYQLLLPKGVSPLAFMANMRLLEEEDPKLRVVWKPEVKEIHVQLMGKIQMEVLQRLIWDRFGVPVSFGPGSIVYKETIARPVEGVGHFEPLRHYAEVHLLMSPGELGSGITVDTVCSEDVLDRNWQRLIATHVEERVHKGVLTGSALTDVHFTIVTGRAHIKHTEGGDFRQATYRAIRQGLKSTESLLLEPYYNLLLEVPMEFVGRALTDLEQRFAKVDAPEFTTRGTREMAIIRGRAPVSTMQEYIGEVHAYTQGLGALTLDVSGYDICHNPEEVIEKRRYDSELDFRNPTSSVFCAHGSGFAVPWDEVPAFMHMDYVFPPEKLAALWENRAEQSAAGNGAGGNGESAADAGNVSAANAEKGNAGGNLGNTAGSKALSWLTVGLAGGVNNSRAGKGFASDEAEMLSGAASRQTSWSRSVSRMSEVELDAELADVYAREFGMSKSDMEEQERRKWMKKKSANAIPEGLSGKPRKVKYDQHGNPIYPKADARRDFLIVDGYNVIFSWEELKELSKLNIDAARDKLIDLLSNYQGYKRCRLAVVFDAYKVKENPGKSMFYDGVSRKMTTLKAAREKAAAAQNAATAQKAQAKAQSGSNAGAKAQGGSNAGAKAQSGSNAGAKAQSGMQNLLPQGIEVIYTRTDEIADARIERMVHDDQSKYRISVVTNDGLEQLTILSMGALRMTAKDLQQDMERMERQAMEEFRAKNLNSENK